MNRLSLWGAAFSLAALLTSTSAFAQTTPSAFTTGYRYDVVGRVTGTIAPDPDGTGPIGYAAVRTTYDSGGQPILVESGQLADWQSEQVEPRLWSGFTAFTTKEVGYDAMNRKVVELLREGGATGPIRAMTQYSYDTMSRLECTAVRMNPAAFTATPATPACTLGAQGTGTNDFGPDRITRNKYDAAGQLTQIRKAVGVAGLEQAYATYGHWDAATGTIKPGNTPNGKQEFVVDANGNKARLTYDGFDRQNGWYFPSTTTPAAFNAADEYTALASSGAVSATDYEAYGYDANGNRTSMRKRDGRLFTLSYDALNRMTSKIVPDACVSGYACTNVPASMTRDVYYSYDLRGLQTAARFDSASGADAVTSGYDGFGRQTSSTISMGGVSRTLAYEYDANGNRARVTHPDSTYFIYDYDGLNRPIAARENGSTAVATMTWNARGQRSGEGRGAVTSTYGYDGISRLNSLADDLAGSAEDVTTTFGYNPADQITSKQRTNTTYAFPGYVNVNRSYAANGLNQYAIVGGTAFGYDSNGNLTSDGSMAYTYDAENRLVVTSAGANLTYDPLGRLWQVSKPTTGATRFLYDGDQLTAEYDGAGAMLRRYVHGTGDDDPLLWYEGAGLSDRRSLQIDHQGSIVSVADAGGNRLAINAYDEYGIPDGGNEGRFQYTGQAWIPELGMYHYKARIYSPTLGRFLQTDPIGYQDQVNLYTYVANDPVNGKDPSGQRCVTANAGSVYCLRRDIYRAFDSIAGSKTRFFGAAAATVEYLANNDIPLLGNVISDQAEGFLKNVSASLYSMNAKTYAGIMDGSISSRNLDAKLVHMEQTRVQSMIDALPEGDRASIIGSINSAFAGRFRSWSGTLSESDTRYNRVLDGVVKGLGRSIDFGNQGDREAIGNALIKDLRSSGACTQTGSRISTC